MKRALYQQRTHDTKGHRLKVRDCAMYQCTFTNSWPGMLRCIHKLKVEGRQLSTFYAVAVLLLPYTRYDICLLDTISQFSQNVSVVYVRVSRHLTECLRIVHTKEKERKKKVFRATQCYYTVIFIRVFSIYRIDSNREVSLIDRNAISVCSLRDGELAIIDSRSKSSICEKCESELSRGERVHVHRRTMAELRVYRFFVILVHLAIVLVFAQNPIEEKTTFEAAFQGKCNQSKYLSKLMPTADIFRDVFDQFGGNVCIPIASIYVSFFRS